jgi:branched-chain amino acid transport system substrate-binding protein
MVNKGNKFLKNIMWCVLLALVVMSGSIFSVQAAKKGEIFIGVSAAITGPAPLDGVRTKQGVEMAVAEINKKGGVLGKKLKLLIEDDQNTANIAVNAVNKLLSQNIVALIGPHRSGNAMAVEQTVLRNKIPYFTGGTSPKLVTLNNPYLFRVRASDTLVAKIAAKYAVDDLKAKKIGMLFNNDEYGAGAKQVIEDYLKSVKIPLICEGHNTGDKDMTGQIMKMKNSNIDCFIVWTHDAEGPVVARQVKELNLNVPFVGSCGFSTVQMLSLMDNNSANGIISATDFFVNSSEPRVKAFVKKFKAKYNVMPEMYAACYYDVIYVLADAIKRAKSTDREAIREALMATKNFKGVMSTLTTNSKGELVHEAVIVKNKNKVPELIKTVKE